MTKPSHYQRIYAVIQRIPHGRVATYGQIAALAGLPRNARQVGYALSRTPDGLVLPWHRVVNAQGQVSMRSRPGSDDFQQVLLAEEGVEFGEGNRISLKRFQWQPRQASLSMAPTNKTCRSPR